MGMKSGVIGVVFLLFLTGCSLPENFSPHALVENDFSKGQLTWIDSEGGDKGWLLQCPNPNDRYLYRDVTSSEIATSEEALNFCSEEAANLTIPEPFDITYVEEEIKAFIAAVPKYTDCASDFGLRMGNYAVDNAEFLFEMAELQRGSGDFIGGALSTRSATLIRNAGYYLQLTNVAAPGSLANTCNEIQF